jgi:malate dehydrogenase (oxaloacetate-decarboxylating)(NADP+)
VQFEDFANHNAFRLLEKYRDRICTFNDDIQGTAAVTVAGIFSALRVTGKPITAQHFLCLGAGEAAIGISDLLTQALREEGLDEAPARARCFLVDSKGLVVGSRSDLNAHKRRYAHDHPPVATFLDAVRTLQPTAIIGVAATPGAFSRDVVEAMAAQNERPIVFALSNPTSKAECTAEDAYRWSGGRALFASGSPFDAVTLDGRRLVPRQSNNSYIFPGVGLGVLASRALRVTDSMFMASAQALAASVTESDLAQGSLFPPLHAVRDVSARIATAVAEIAFREDLATIERPADLASHVRARMYDPRYPSYA